MKKILCAMLCALLAVTPVFAGAETITVSFAGDCTLGDYFLWKDDPHAFHNVVEPLGYAYPFEKVLPVFAEDDLTVVNLEGVLADTEDGLASKRRYNFRGKTEYTEILRLGSIEAVSLGNNHTNDYRTPGLESTKAALDKAGIGWALDDRPYIFEKNGIRIAFLSYLGSSFYAHQKELPEIISSLKEEQGCAAVVMLIHTGTEYARKHKTSQRRCAEASIRAGADLVVQNHAHVLQGVSSYQNRYIMYSLGNFCFGGSRSISSDTSGSVIAQVAFDFDENGVYAGQKLTLYPCRNNGGGNGNNYQPSLLTGEEARRVIHEIDKDSDYPLFYPEEGCSAPQPYLPAEGPNPLDEL